MKKNLPSAVLVTLAASAAVLTSSGSASAAPTAEVFAEHVTVRTVLAGSMPSVRGNQHRLSYITDTEGMQWPRAAMKIQSYFCPSGSRITYRWTSSRCTYRSTSYIEYDRRDFRVSSTMRSARVDGVLTSGTKRWQADLTLFAVGEQKVGDYGPDAVIRSSMATVSGTVGGTPVRSDARGDSVIHRLERR